MRKSIVVMAAIMSLCFATLAAVASGPRSPGKSGPGKSGPSKPGNQNHPKPGHGTKDHLPPGYHHHPRARIVPGGAGGAELPWQEVRYLRVANNSEETLTVFGQLAKDGPTYRWTVNPGATTFLAIDGERVLAANVYLWGKSETKNWTSGRDGVTMVSEPYQANEPGVFTYNFNP